MNYIIRNYIINRPAFLIFDFWLLRRCNITYSENYEAKIKEEKKSSTIVIKFKKNSNINLLEEKF